MSRLLKHATGFTLIEVLIALSVGMLILLAVSVGWQQILRVSSSEKAHMVRLKQLQLTWAYLARDIEQVVDRDIVEPSGMLLTGVEGFQQKFSISRIGTLPADEKLPRSELTRVYYHVEKNNLKRKICFYMENFTATECVERTVLENIEEIKFFYLDSNRQWQNQWPISYTYQDKLPRGILVYFKIKDQGEITQLFLLPAQNWRQ